MNTDHKPFNGHTSLPWKIGIAGPNGMPTVGTIQGLMTAHVTVGVDHPHEANAAFIVHACNTFYTREAELSSLRESLKMCVEAMEKTKDEVIEQGQSLLIHWRGSEGDSLKVESLRSNGIAKLIATTLSHVKSTHPNL